MMTLVNSTCNRHWTIYVHICCNCSHCPSVCPLFPTELCRNQARMIMEKYLHKCSIAGEATTLVTNGFPSTRRLRRLAANWTCSTPLWTTARRWMSRPFQMKTKKLASISLDTVQHKKWKIKYKRSATALSCHWNLQWTYLSFSCSQNRYLSPCKGKRSQFSSVQSISNCC